LGNMTTFEYNVLNQLVNVTDQQGNATTYTYDAKGNRTSVTDPKGNVSTYEYSFNSQPIRVTDALGSVTTYTYGGAGCQSCGGGTDKLTSVTDANNHIIGYQYDSSGRLIRMTDQLGNIETYTYDLNGNLLTMTDRKSQTTSYAYDSLNRMTQATYADGSYTTYAYDATGKVTTIADSVSVTISYTYSTATSGGPVGKVINETTPQGSISYTYDAIGRSTSLTVAGQPPVTYQYDANSRLINVGVTLSGHPVYFGISYDALGRRTSLTLPNGITTNYSYDNIGHILNLEYLNPLNVVLESIGYTYDKVGNRLSMDRVSQTQPKPNPVSATPYNEANQMLTFNDKNIAYDANGNMISVMNSCGTTNYTWDERNRLIGINGFTSMCTSVSASFKYDALGRRIEKTINGRTIKYLYDGSDIVQEIENGVPSVNYIRTLSIDEPLARIQSNGTVRYYQSDALGSIIALTDETGTIRTRDTYDAFGKVTISGESSDNPFQYTGRENDGTGLYYYRARYYNPELQRFISEDPLRLDSGDVNFYAYVGNNPINFTDPSGLAIITGFCCKCSGVSAGKACDAYLKCKSYDLWFACKGFPDDCVSRCIRKCLLNKWNNCKYDNGLRDDHIACYKSCLNNCL
jgi:RHS repeat-associated protein